MTQALWTRDEVLKALGGTARGQGGNWEASGVSIDSRSLAKGDLFIALEGPNTDGHDHVASALEKGA
ncbi:MAG: Mur ligase domain-containing protein, partial [Limibacillus sp.]